MAKKAYQCDRCDQVHDFHHEAERCCQPEVITVWLCPICDEAHEDEEEADTCCADKNVDGRLVTCPNCFRGHDSARESLSIEVAGHCSECNPFYTVDQQFQIGDRLNDLEDDRKLQQRIGI